MGGNYQPAMPPKDVRILDAAEGDGGRKLVHVYIVVTNFRRRRTCLPNHLHATMMNAFFLFIHYSRATYQTMARLFTVRFLSAVRAVAARCKRPFLPSAQACPTKM